VSTIVKGSLIQRFLKVDATALSRWHRSGHLVRYARGSYDMTSLDEFIASCARNFDDSPPTWSELRSGALVLLKHSEIVALYNLPRERLQSLQRSTELAHLKLPGLNGGIRYRQTDILRLIDISTPLISSKEAAQILGLETTQVIKVMVAKGKLQSARNFQTPNHVHITTESFIAFLRERLPGWVNPEDWIEDCKCSTQPLVPAAKAAILLGVSQREVVSILKQHRAWYVAAPDGKRNVMVSPIWLAAQTEYKPPLEVDEIAKIYDVHADTVKRWEKGGLFTCPIPDHPHPTEGNFLWEPCLVAILIANSSPGYQRELVNFIRSRRRGKGPSLLSTQEAADRLGCGPSQVARMAEKGSILGIRTPTAEWRFTVGQIKSAQRKIGGY
jgi:hypothetical protein